VSAPASFDACYLGLGLAEREVQVLEFEAVRGSLEVLEDLLGQSLDRLEHATDGRASAIEFDQLITTTRDAAHHVFGGRLGLTASMAADMCGGQAAVEHLEDAADGVGFDGELGSEGLQNQRGSHVRPRALAAPSLG
jgi:hypothetical protein